MHSFYGTLLVGLGGFLGSMLRFWASGFIQQGLDPLGSFPYGTMAVNVVGSAIIGFLAGAADARFLLGPEMRLFLLVGVLGGFTTFSTFSYETLNLFRGGEVALGLANMGVTMTLCLVAVALGYELGYRA